MRVVVQRCAGATVLVDGDLVGKVDGVGAVLLVGVATSDTASDVAYMVDKIAHLRIFPDEAGRMNRDILQVGGSVLSISQFTLYGDVRKGRRPNYMDAAGPQDAKQLYEDLNNGLLQAGIPVSTGVFGADMKVTLTNDGPVTILLDSQKLF